MSNRANHQLTGAREPINLIVDGVKTEFLMSPLRDVDLSELDLWLQGVYTRQSLREMGEEQHKQIEAKAVTLSAFRGEGSEMLACVDGIARFCWQSINRSHPTVTYEQLREIMVLEDNQFEFKEKFKWLNSVPTTKPKSDKVEMNKAEIYCALADMNRWSFETIANMTPLQQLVALSKGTQGTGTAYFETEQQLNEWLASRNQQ